MGGQLNPAILISQGLNSVQPLYQFQQALPVPIRYCRWFMQPLPKFGQTRRVDSFPPAGVALGLLRDEHWTILSRIRNLGATGQTDPWLTRSLFRTPQSIATPLYLVYSQSCTHQILMRTVHLVCRLPHRASHRNWQAPPRHGCSTRPPAKSLYGRYCPPA